MNTGIKNPPTSLRALIDYLRAYPTVHITTRYANIVSRTQWRFTAFHNGMLTFAPLFKGRKMSDEMGFALYPRGDSEAGLEFFPNGVVYTRGLMRVEIYYDEGTT